MTHPQWILWIQDYLYVFTWIYWFLLWLSGESVSTVVPEFPDQALDLLPLTQICGATSTIPKGQHWSQIWLEICLCNDWISHSTLIRGKCANPIGIQCRPCTVSDKKSIRGSLRCPGPVGQWAQYHSLHRQQCAGVRDSHPSAFDHIFQYRCNILVQWWF